MKTNVEMEVEKSCSVNNRANYNVAYTAAEINSHVGRTKKTELPLPVPGAGANNYRPCRLAMQGGPECDGPKIELP